MKFADIPQFTPWGGYACDIPWVMLESHLKDWDRSGKLDLDPDFQRAHVWKEKQQIEYVQYILKGGRSGRDILWNSVGFQQGRDTPIVLVDGKQRLESVRKFLRNELPVFGYRYSEFTDRLSFVEDSFRFHVNSLNTRREVLQWYLDLNTGGTVHTSTEIEKVRKLLEQEK